MRKDGATHRIITDHLGSPRLIVDVGTGEIRQRMQHDEWGRVLRDTHPGYQPFGFAGYLTDVRVKSLHTRHRDLDPSIGRWLAKEPKRFTTGETNLYSYAFADPVNFADPDGLDPEGAIVKALLDDINRYGLNRCPPTPTEIAFCYKPRPLGSGVFHGDFKGNAVYDLPGGFECVYGPDGSLIDTGPLQGTYNYYPPHHLMHVVSDLFPFLLNPINPNGYFQNNFLPLIPYTLTTPLF